MPGLLSSLPLQTALERQSGIGGDSCMLTDMSAMCNQFCRIKKTLDKRTPNVAEISEFFYFFLLQIWPRCQDILFEATRIETSSTIGHIRLTHLHLLTGKDLPTCQFCNIPLTVNHILVECPNLNPIRQRFFRVSSLKNLFDNIDNHVIIDFIKETHFYALV